MPGQPTKTLGKYKFDTFRIAHATESELLYRPTLATLGNMLIFSAIVLAVGFLFLRGARSLGSAPGREERLAEQKARYERMRAQVADSMKGALGEEKWAEAKKELAEKHARRVEESEASESKRERILRFLRIACYAVGGLLLVVGLMAPLSCLWGKVAIRVTPGRELEVFERGTFFGTTRRWPLEAIQSVKVGAMGIERGVKRAQRVWAGWHWAVQLVTADGVIDFIPYVDKSRQPPAQAPRRVREFLAWLQRSAGIGTTSAGV